MHHEDIKAAIRKKGVTPAEVARHLGVSAQLVSAVITGTSKSQRVAQAISRITGLPMNTLWPNVYDSKKPARTRMAELLGRA